MSLLAQQLNSLKQSSLVTSIAPGAPRPTMILDKQTARNTTVDVLYTMALIGYAEIKKSIFHSGRQLAQELLSEQYREINRNKLTKEENNVLSLKLTRFLLVISPVFLTKGCQTIIEYLIRNFNIHIFQSQQIIIIFLQYWQQQSFRKLITNIQLKSPSTHFLRPLQQQKQNSKSQPQQININYIIKSLCYSRSLVHSLILFCRKYIKQQNSQSQEQQIQLVSRPTLYKNQIETQSSSVIRNDYKQFVMFVLCTILQRRISDFDREIAQFCVFLAKQDSEDVYSMSMVLSLYLLGNSSQTGTGHGQWIHKAINSLVNKSPELSQNIFSFVIIIWQRWPELNTKQIISTLLQKQHFVLRMTQSENNLSMPYYCLAQYLLSPTEEQHENKRPKLEITKKATILQILKAITLKIKNQQFVKIHELHYFPQIFKLLHKNCQKLDQKVVVSFTKFVAEHLAYEYAVFIDQTNSSNSNKSSNKNFEYLRPLQGIFSKQQYHNGKFAWDKIKKLQAEQFIQEKNQQQSEQVQQSQEQVQPAPHPSKTLLQLLNSKPSFKKHQLSSVNPSDQQTFNQLVVLLQNYYNPQVQHELTQHQKNTLLQYPELMNKLYNIQWFYIDLQRRDYSTAIKFMMIAGNVSMCERVLRQYEDVEAVADMLYRELCRQTIDRLAMLSRNHYKAVINTLAKLYNQYSKNSQSELLKPLNELMLKISQTILSQSGLQKGKYYKLIACHSRFLANLTISPVYGNNGYAYQTYNRLIQIFGYQNAYCFVIGAAELLATKVRNKKYFGNFIEKIFVPSLKAQSEGNNADEDFIQFLSLLNLLKTVYKCIMFSVHTLSEQFTQNGQKQVKEKQNQNVQQELQKQRAHQQLKSLHLQQGVAKKMIINFFGLTTPKNKRAIVRKLFLFLSSLLKSHIVCNMFKMILQKLTRKKHLKLCSIVSKIYNLLIALGNATQGPLRQAIEMVKNKVLTLFPFQLRIDILGPLLPRNQIYKELSNELSSIASKQFKSLSIFVNILPNQASDQWCGFTIQCLKRNYVPSQQNCSQILSLYSAGQSQNIYNTNIIKFICSMTQYAKEHCLTLLPKMMQIIFNQCQDPNSYTLAIFYTLSKNLKEFIDPYLSQIFGLSIQIKDENVRKFIDGIVDSFMPPTLITLVKNHSKTVKNVENFSYFLLKISGKLSFELIWKTTQTFFSRSLATLIQNQLPYSQLHNLQSQIFVNQVMKMNDNQLRKIIIDYVRWSSEKTNEDAAMGLLFGSRKNLLALMFAKLASTIGELFVQYFGFIFDIYVEDLKIFSILDETKHSTETKDKVGRRQRQLSQYSLQCSTEYLKQVLNSLKALFQHDPNNQFMDSIKFDKISPHLTNIFNLTKLPNYSQLIEKTLKPCLITLLRTTKDDYKLKSINTEILRMLRTKDQRINSQIYGFYDDVVEAIDYRFLIFVDEMVPLLMEASGSRNPSVKKSVQSIIYKIQNLSGQKITQIKSDR